MLEKVTNLLQLETPAIFDNFVSPICLSPQGARRSPLVKNVTSLAGVTCNGEGLSQTF